MSIVISALLAMIAYQLPVGTSRLECGLTEATDEAGAEPTRLAIILHVRGDRIDSAEIEGPPLFSSTQGIMVFDATPDRRGNMNISESQPSRRALRWTARLEGGRIELARQNSRITLEPDPAAEGNWRGSYDLGEISIGHMRAEGPSGTIMCRPAGTGSTGP